MPQREREGARALSSRCVCALTAARRVRCADRRSGPLARLIVERLFVAVGAVVDIARVVTVNVGCVGRRVRQFGHTRAHAIGITAAAAVGRVVMLLLLLLELQPSKWIAPFDAPAFAVRLLLLLLVHLQMVYSQRAVDADATDGAATGNVELIGLQVVVALQT